MKLLKRIVLIVLLLPVVLLIVSLFLPSKYHVERSVVIKAPTATIFPWINNPSRWPEWTAWTTEKDPTLTYAYSGPVEGAGAASEWTSQKMGSGSMKFTSADPQKGIRFDLSFDGGKFQSKGALLLDPVGDSTKVTWSNDGELGGNPIFRYLGLFMDKMVGRDYEEGLEKLRRKLAPN